MEPYPHVHMPNKPITNGMMLRTAATLLAHPALTSGKLPYYIDIVPHLRPNDGGGINSKYFNTCLAAAAIKIVMDHYPPEWRKPVVVADRGYGTFALLDAIAAWGGTATLSLGTKECKNLHVPLSYNLPLNAWRMCMNAKGYIFSAQCKFVENANGTTSIGKKFIISNAFKVKPLLSNSISLVQAANTGK